MQSPPTWLDFQSQKVASGLLTALHEDTLTGLPASYARIVLWYYQSPIHLIPDIVPGLGFLDDYILIHTAMWICGTPPNEESADFTELPTQINFYLNPPEEETETEEGTETAEAAEPAEPAPQS